MLGVGSVCWYSTVAQMMSWEAKDLLVEDKEIKCSCDGHGRSSDKLQLTLWMICSPVYFSAIFFTL